MQKKTYLIVFVMLLMFGYQSFAQNAKELIQNTVQIAEGVKNLNRDTKELAELKEKVIRFNKEFEARNLSGVKRMKVKILEDLRREVQQSEVKAVKARREIAQSSAEIRSDRRELHRDRNDSYQRGRYDARDDRTDLRRDQVDKIDDKRDRRDDRRDFQAQVERAEQQKRIYNGLLNFTFGFGEDLLTKSIAQKALIEKFIHTMEDDLAATKRELAEDARESGEDHLERRDDRRERNEIDTRRRRY